MKRWLCFALLLPLSVLVPACAPTRQAASRSREAHQLNASAAEASPALSRLPAGSSTADVLPDSRAAEGSAPPPVQPAAFHEQQQEDVAAPQAQTAGGALPPVDVDEGRNEPLDWDALLRPDAPTLTLEELADIALHSNPSLAEARAVVAKAEGVYEQVGLLPNPTVGYFGEEIGDGGTAGKQGAFLSQTFVTGGKLRRNREAAAWDVESLSWESEVQLHRVLNDVQLQYYEVLGAQQRVETARELSEIAQEGVRAAEQLVEFQQVARPDLLQARIEANRIGILLANAENEYRASWRKLVNAVGQPELAPVRLEGELDGELPQLEWQAVYDRLLAASPLLQAVHMRVQRAQAQIDREHAQAVPNLVTQAVVTHDNASGDDLAGVQIGLPLPLFNRNQGAIDAAYAELRRAQREVDRLQLLLRNQLADAMRDYQNARQQVVRYREAMMPDAEENLDLAEEGYRQGQFDFFTVLTARRSLFETSLAYVDALTNLRTAETLLDGMLLSDSLSEVPEAALSAGQRGQALSTN